MIDAWSIGVAITLDDALTGQIEGVAEKFGEVQAAVDNINKTLRLMPEGMSVFVSASRTMASSWRDAAKAAQDMASASGAVRTGAPPNLVPMPEAGERSPYYTSSLGTNTPYSPGYYPGDDTQPAPDPIIEPVQPPRDPKQPPRQPGGDNSSMHIMSSLFIAQAVGSMAKQAAQAVTGPSFDLQQQEETLASMGASPEQIAQAIAQAGVIQRNPRNPGITLGQALSMITDLYSVDRSDFAGVLSMSTAYAQDAFVLSQQKNGGDAMDVMYNILRSGEDSGKLGLLNKDGTLDLTKIERFNDLITRMVVNSGGNLSPAGVLTMFGAAGPGITQMSDEAIEKALLMSQALGPSQTGTGINAMYQEFIGGKMSQGTARALHDAGVLPDYMFGKDGKILKKYRYGIGMAMIPEGALTGEAEALSDPFGWSTKYLFGKYMNADGTVKTGDEKTVETLIANLNRDYSRIPGMKDAGYAIFQGAVMDRQLKNIGKVQTVPDIASNYASTANAQLGDFGAAVNNLLVQLVSPLIPGATAGLKTLTGGLDLFAKALDVPGVGVTAASAAEVGFAYGGWVAMRGGIKFMAKLGRMVTGAAADEGAAAAGVELVGGGTGGPIGFIIATAAVAAVNEILDSRQNGPVASGRIVPGGGRYGPAGTSSDPIHVVTSQQSGGAGMPAGPTTPTASSARPNPGQALKY
jgi:hypothetical protein